MDVLSTKLSRRGFLGTVLKSAVGIVVAKAGLKPVPGSPAQLGNLSSSAEEYELCEVEAMLSPPPADWKYKRWLDCNGPMFKRTDPNGCRLEASFCSHPAYVCPYDALAMLRR